MQSSNCLDENDNRLSELESKTITINSSFTYDNSSITTIDSHEAKPRLDKTKFGLKL